MSVIEFSYTNLDVAFVYFINKEQYILLIINPMAAEQKRPDRMSDDMRRFNTAMQPPPGEIPGGKCDSDRTGIIY